jgi:predicted RecA/RadA family phage recombinase
MKNYIQKGGTLTFIAAGVLAAGAGVLLGDQGLFGINSYDVAIGEEGEAKAEGVFNLPKVAATAIDQFDIAYWDDGNKVVTPVALSNTAIGYFTQPALSADTHVDVLLAKINTITVEIPD